MDDLNESRMQWGSETKEQRARRSEKGDHVCGGYYRLTVKGLRRRESNRSPFFMLKFMAEDNGG